MYISFRLTEYLFFLKKLGGAKPIFSQLRVFQIPELTAALSCTVNVKEIVIFFSHLNFEASGCKNVQTRTNLNLKLSNIF